MEDDYTIISEYEIERLQRQKISNYIYDKTTNSSLKRLAQIAGFIIRRIEPQWDIQTYKRERDKFINLYPEDVELIDKFLIKYAQDLMESHYSSLVRFYSAGEIS